MAFNYNLKNIPFDRTKKLTEGDITGLVDSVYVHLTGNETIAGIKTFSSFPVTPSEAPTDDYQVANKKYVDDKDYATTMAIKTFGF